MANAIYFRYGGATVCRMSTIGTRIRDKRKALGLRQGDLAPLIGVDQSTVSDIERGQGFGAEILMKLCEALRVDPYSLMNGEQGAQAEEALLLSLFRSCSEADRRNLLDSADAFAARNEKTHTVAAKKSTSVMQRLNEKLNKHLGPPIQETYVDPQVRKKKGG